MYFEALGGVGLIAFGLSVLGRVKGGSKRLEERRGPCVPPDPLREIRERTTREVREIREKIVRGEL